VYRNGTQVATSATTSYSDTGLSSSTSYTYTVSAFDAAGNNSIQSTSASATTQVAPDTTPPSVPAGLTATATSSSQINLSWTASTDNVGVTGYNVYRNGTQIATSATTSYSDTGLSASTSYSYTVSAFDAAGNNSAQSTSASATTQVAPDTTPPSVPAGLTATATSSSQINLSWTASTDNVGVTGYKVFRNGAQVATSATTSYSDTGLSASTSYSYTVSAFDAAGNNSAQSTSASATTQAPPDTTPPSVPAGLTATATSSSQINLSWTASTDNVGVTGYKVYRNGTQVASSATTSYSDTGLSSSTSYSYTVSAFDAAGNNSAQSASANATTQARIITFVNSSKAIAPIGASSLSWAHTISSGLTDTILVVGVGTYGGLKASVSGITYGSQNFTKIIRSNDGVHAAATELWYLVNPAIGTNNINVTMTSSTNDTIIAGAMTFAHVNQTAPIDVSAGHVTGNGSSSNSVTINTINNNDSLVDIILGPTAQTPAAGQTATLNQSSDGFEAGSYKGPISNPGAASMSWTYPANSTVSAMSVAALKVDS